MTTPVTLSQWMKRLRAARDLTQEQLAEQVGCAAQTVRMLETGRRRPSREMAERLADVLGIPPEHREAFLRTARTPPNAAPATPTATAPPPLATRHLALPQPPNSLIGRQEERAALRRAFGEERSRLVTLVGPGGIGKTRLALQAAVDLAEDAALDAVWVALALFDSAQIVPAMAEAIGVALPGDEQSAEHLLAGAARARGADRARQRRAPARSCPCSGCAWKPPGRKPGRPRHSDPERSPRRSAACDIARAAAPAGRVGDRGCRAIYAHAGPGRGSRARTGDHPVPGTRPPDQPHVCADPGQPRGRRRDLPPARRDAAGDRAGRRLGSHALARGDRRRDCAQPGFPLC